MILTLWTIALLLHIITDAVLRSKPEEEMKMIWQQAIAKTFSDLTQVMKETREEEMIILF